MIGTLRLETGKVFGWAGLEAKFVLAYTTWVYVMLFSRLVLLVSVVSFWQAAYQNTQSLSGLSAVQTLNYVMLVNVFADLMNNYVIFDIGIAVKTGQIIVEMLRPVNFRFQLFVRTLASNLFRVVLVLPVMIVALVFFGLQLPGDPRVWLAFALSALLGYSVLFCFDWILGCLTFYTSEVWGLSVLRSGIALFLSGAVVPLAMMPDWLHNLANLFPFAQAVAAPISLLSGATPLAEAPRVWLVQGAWLVALYFLSRYVWNVASRKVTVQGG